MSRPTNTTRRFRTRVIGALCGLLGLSGGGSAFAATFLDLMPDLLGKNEELASQKAKLQQDGFGKEIAEGDWLPKVEFTAYGGREGIRQDPNSKHSNYDPSKFETRVTQLLWDFGKTNAGIDAADSQLAISRLNLRKKETDILQSGIAAYLNLIKAAKTLEFQRQTAENIRKLYQQENVRVESGSGLGAGVLKAKSSLAGSEATVVDAESELMTAANTFVRLFHQEPDDPDTYQWPLVPWHLLPETIEDAEARMRDHEPAYLSALRRLERQKQLKDKNDSQYVYPSVNLIGVSTNQYNDGGLAGAKDDYLVKVELKYNLFNQMKDYNTQKQDLASIDEQRNEAEKTVMDNRRSLQNAWVRLKKAEAKAEHLRLQAVVAGEYLDRAKEQLHRGSQSLLEILDEQNKLIDAQVRLLGAETDKTLAFYDLMATLGMLTPEIFQPELVKPENAPPKPSGPSFLRKGSAKSDPLLGDAPGNGKNGKNGKSGKNGLKKQLSEEPLPSGDATPTGVQPVRESAKPTPPPPKEKKETAPAGEGSSEPAAKPETTPPAREPAASGDGKENGPVDKGVPGEKGEKSEKSEPGSGQESLLTIKPPVTAKASGGGVTVASVSRPRVTESVAPSRAVEPASVAKKAPEAAQAKAPVEPAAEASQAAPAAVVAAAPAAAETAGETASSGGLFSLLSGLFSSAPDKESAARTDEPAARPEPSTSDKKAPVAATAASGAEGSVAPTGFWAARGIDEQTMKPVGWQPPTVVKNAPAKNGPAKGSAAKNAPAKNAPAKSAAAGKDAAKVQAEGFTVQVASFRAQSQARAMAERWRDKGYDPFVQQITHSDGTPRHAVRIGHFRTREVAETTRQAIAGKEGEAANPMVARL